MSIKGEWGRGVFAMTGKNALPPTTKKKSVIEPLERSKAICKKKKKKKKENRKASNPSSPSQSGEVVGS